MTHKFDGFPPGKPRVISLPATFVTNLLPLIDDLAELKVTLSSDGTAAKGASLPAPDRLHKQRGIDERISGLRARKALEQTLDTALHSACERGSLVCADVLKLEDQLFY
jgi:hypothetical protein